jgi:arylformamidase
MGDPVFRHYDQRALDAEYNNRAKVKDAPEWLARYDRESRLARAELACRLDLAYGAHAGERLDVFPAGGSRPAPVHVFVHGGYWHRLDKADFSFVARALVPAGVATVVVNYALIPSVDMDELVRQCRASIAWVHANAASFGGDPGRLFVSGHSAGGHLTAMLLATDWRAVGGLPADVVKGGVAISGLYDLEPIRLSYLNEILKLSSATARKYSPVLLPPPREGRLVLAVGGNEGPEYHRQTTDLAGAWARAGFKSEVLDLPGLDHFSIMGEFGRPEGRVARVALRQMGLA